MHKDRNFLYGHSSRKGQLLPLGCGIRLWVPAQRLGEFLGEQVLAPYVCHLLSQLRVHVQVLVG